MLEPDDKDALVAVMNPLVEGLHDALDRGYALAQQHYTEYDMTGLAYQSGMYHLARSHGRRLLVDACDLRALGAWEVAAPRPNVQILLRHEQLTLRLLRPIGTTLPPPGPNVARRAYYTNIHDNLLGVYGSTLIGLWTVDADSGEVEVRIVRPVGTWKYGATAKLDIDFLLPRNGSLGDLEFRSVEDLDVKLPFEEEAETNADDESDDGGA